MTEEQIKAAQFLRQSFITTDNLLEHLKSPTSQQYFLNREVMLKLDISTRLGELIKLHQTGVAE